MSVNSAARQLQLARPDVIDGDVVSAGASRSRSGRGTEFFFCTAVLLAQASWLGALGYLAFRLI